MATVATMATMTTTTTTAAVMSMTQCSSILPAAGTFSLGPDLPLLTLAADATVWVDCPLALPDLTASSSPVAPTSTRDIRIDLDALDNQGPAISEFRDPFLASTFPVCYALAACTVTAYLLLILLFISPRIPPPEGGVVYLGRWGFTNGSGGVRVGGRPWLQKAAALLVTVSLTIASVDTFRVAQRQYTWGVQNARLLQREVLGSDEIKAIGLVSDTFLWLAQAQTLIRLFPRHRDQVIIKWAAFALITLDSIFSALNSFVMVGNGSSGSARPRSFVEPVSTLSYLMHLALGLIYAGWVMVYSITKRRYAFCHHLMKNMPLVAAISLMAVLTPVAFFILDLCQPDVTGWSEYVRWVGAAAASVVVWVWVERIEEIEREEKKDGVLGRELLDGDEALEVGAADMPWMLYRKREDGGDDDDSPGGGGAQGQNPIQTQNRNQSQGQSQSQSHGHSGRVMWPGVTSITSRYREQQRQQYGAGTDGSGHRISKATGERARLPIWPTRPAPTAASPFRTDSPSVSTDYTVVRYQPTDATGQTPEPASQIGAADSSRSENPDGVQTSSAQAASTVSDPIPESPPGSRDRSRSSTVRNSGQGSSAIPSAGPAGPAGAPIRSCARWRTLATPLLRRGGEAPPAVVLSQQRGPTEISLRTTRGTLRGAGDWDLRTCIGDFAANRAERFRERMRPTPQTDSLPVTVIPAPPRHGEVLAQMLDGELAAGRPISRASVHSAGSRSGMSPADVEPVAATEGAVLLPGTRGGEGPSNPPPLWPGVESARDYDDDDDVDEYTLSSTES